MEKSKSFICNLCGSEILINDPIVFEFHARKCKEWQEEE